MEKARNQFESIYQQELKEDSSLGDLSRFEKLAKLINNENYTDYEYLGQVITEALRCKTVFPTTSVYDITKDCTVANYNFKKGDSVCFVMSDGLHQNSSQWQRPYEFLPERFDSQDPLYLTPDGKKRNPCSFLAFSGGQRGCLGKSFAEITLRILTLYLTETFDFEFKDKEKYEGINNYPMAMAFMNKTIPIHVNLQKRQ